MRCGGLAAWWGEGGAWHCAVELGPVWAVGAGHLHAYLGDSWPAPPWSGDQAATVAMALSLSEEAACDRARLDRPVAGGDPQMG